MPVKYFKDKYRCIVGFSDHSKSTNVPSMAVALGAKVIEKHITLNKNKIVLKKGYP